MTLEQIKAELACLPEEHQAHVMAYLVHLRHLRDPYTRQELARGVDDGDSSHWITPEQLREHWKE